MKALARSLVRLCGCLEHVGGGYAVVPPPPRQPMSASFAFGGWESNFGDVTIERDWARGPGAVSGTWFYFHPQERREVRGTFHGTLTGTVLRLFGTEGAASGHGFLEVSRNGDSYSGQWWTHGRSKTGNWRGWRRGAV